MSLRPDAFAAESAKRAVKHEALKKSADLVKKRISQETFDAAVAENMEEFDMEREEAIEDAIEQVSRCSVQSYGRAQGRIGPTFPSSRRHEPRKLAIFLRELAR